MNSNSLVHRVLKARYFQNTDFLHAELSMKPSFAWRSILSAQSVLHSGYRWQVGDGKSIGVWTDRWLPRPSTFCVLTPSTLLPVNTTVDSLMDQESGEWNLNLINQVFTPRGRFTVNIAYRFARTITHFLPQL